jgi:hypothetical protein
VKVSTEAEYGSVREAYADGVIAALVWVLVWVLDREQDSPLRGVA